MYQVKLVLFDGLFKLLQACLKQLHLAFEPALSRLDLFELSEMNRLGDLS